MGRGMKKRLADAEIWDKPWFRKLSPADKCAIMYIKDKCDNVGVWIPDKEIAEIYIGGTVGWETLPDRSNGNIQILDNGKWWLIDFVDFQWGFLNTDTDNNARLSYIRLLKKHGLWEMYLKQCERSTRGLKEVKETTNNKSKSKNKSNNNSKIMVVKKQIKEVMEYINKITGKRFTNPGSLKRWLDSGFTVQDCKLVILDRWQKWRGTEQEEFVRPSTLFRPSHFTEYLAEAKKALQKMIYPKCIKCGKSLDNEMKNNVHNCYSCNAKFEVDSG